MKNKECKYLSFNDCELSILRMAVDKADTKISKRNLRSPQIADIIKVVEEYLVQKKLICYGGTAINNILPKSEQFYNKDLEIPDYDFFSPSAYLDAIELSDIYYSKGFIDVEAKAGVHHGTYKVFVNYIPVADITFIEKELFDSLKKDAITVDNIMYAPPNFLRMSMYLELSRPAGDTSRWEKVLKRLILLNKNYPLPKLACKKYNFQRKMDDSYNEELIYNIILKTFIDQGVVFFGGYAINLYANYMPIDIKKKIKKYADFDVLANDSGKVAQITLERLKANGIKNVSIIKHDEIAELVPLHYEIKVGKETVAFLYETIACHSYNVIINKKNKIRIATIDTILSFYLLFIYINKPYYEEFKEKLLCMANLLFEVQEKNRLSQKGVLKRFSIICYGHQDSVEEIRAKKAEKFNELKNKRDSNEFKEWFLNYKPHTLNKSKDKDEYKDEDAGKDEDEDQYAGEYEGKYEDQYEYQGKYKKNGLQKKNKIKSKKKLPHKNKNKKTKKSLNKLIFGNNYKN